MEKFAITYHNVADHVITEFSVKAVADTYEQAQELVSEIAHKENEAVKANGGKVKWEIMPSGDAYYRNRRSSTEWLEVREIG